MTLNETTLFEDLLYLFTGDPHKSSSGQEGSVADLGWGRRRAFGSGSSSAFREVTTVTETE